MSKCLKRVVIKEELVALTGDAKKAVLLEQLLYWSDRTKDAPMYREEEQARLEHETWCRSYGWIYKAAEELSEETMLGMSKATVRRHLKALVEKGWIQERRNPDPRYSFDNTFQYRVDRVAIERDLQALGYSFSDYGLEPIESQLKPAVQNETREDKCATSAFQNETTIPEITKPYKDQDLSPTCSGEEERELTQKVIDIWNDQGITVHTRLGPKTRQRIAQALQNILGEISWEELCACINTYSEAYKRRQATHRYRLVEFIERGYEHFLCPENWRPTTGYVRAREDYVYVQPEPPKPGSFSFLDDEIPLTPNPDEIGVGVWGG